MTRDSATAFPLRYNRSFLGAFRPWSVDNGKFIVTGDSHSIYCFAAIREAEIRFIPLITMHRVGRDGIRSVLPADLILKAHDRVIFSFGEIDCRAHVARIAALKGTSIDAVLDDLVERFLETLRELVAATRIEAWISCIVPPGRRTPVREIALSAQYVTDQVSIRRRLNRKLQEGAAQAGLGFLDFYDQIAGPDGALPRRMDIDGNHVNPRRVASILDVVAAALGIRLHKRWIFGEVKRYGGHMSWIRRARKLVSDPPRQLLHAIRQRRHDSG